MQQQLQDHNLNSLNPDEPVLQMETGDRGPITETYQTRAQNQHREPLTPEQLRLCFPPKNNLAKPVELSKPEDEVIGKNHSEGVYISCNTQSDIGKGRGFLDLRQFGRCDLFFVHLQ